MWFDETHRLHGERGRAGDAAETRNVLPDGTDHAFQTDAVMLVKTPVFGGDECLHHPVVTAGFVERAAVGIVRSQPDTHQPAVAVAQDHPRRIDLRLLKRRCTEKIGKHDGEKRENRRRAGKHDKSFLPFRVQFHDLRWRRIS